MLWNVLVFEISVQKYQNFHPNYGQVKNLKFFDTELGATQGFNVSPYLILKISFIFEKHWFWLIF